MRIRIFYYFILEVTSENTDYIVSPTEYLISLSNANVERPSSEGLEIRDTLKDNFNIIGAVE